MASGQVGGSIAYRAFLVHQRAIGSRIRASNGSVTVFYSGSDHGVAVWKQVERLQREWLTRNRVDVRYEMLTDVIRRLPSPVQGFATLYDFATQAHAKKLVTREEDEEIWSMLSAHLAAHTKDRLFVWEGSGQLRSSPILTEIELPVLAYNAKISKLDRKLVQERMKKVQANEAALREIDRDFREFYERYRKRNSLLSRYGMADQLSRSWH